MSHANTTIAEHMRAVMLFYCRPTITRLDIALLDECGSRCTHTNLLSVRWTERARRIFMALDLSPLFVRDKKRVRQGWRVEYRLLESIADTGRLRCNVCGTTEHHVDEAGNIVENPP